MLKIKDNVDLHILLAKLNYEIAITLCEVNNPELIREYQERLLMEYTELVSKFNKLECFIKYNKIDKEKEELKDSDKE